jgi:thiamine phosphate synthase YjbQ (UPF0047 family)
LPGLDAACCVCQHVGVDNVVQRDLARALSRWQGVFFCEFDGPRLDRRVVCTVIPDAS